MIYHERICLNLKMLLFIIKVLEDDNNKQAVTVIYHSYPIKRSEGTAKGDPYLYSRGQ